MASTSEQPRAEETPTPTESVTTKQEEKKKADPLALYRLPHSVLQNAKRDEVKDVAESPFIAFINSRSGGRAGPELLTSLYDALGYSQVYDVLTDRPDVVLKTIWENLNKMEKTGDTRVAEIKRKMKIIACGGDGTVTWVMKVVNDLNLDPPPAIAIIPLGTGNDLSRTFKWGSTFKTKWIKGASAMREHLQEMAQGAHRELDCWRIDIRAPEKGYFEDLPHVLKISNEEGTSVDGCSWNYLSIGMDAQSAYGFHHLREGHPRWASGRMMNQMWYGCCGIKAGWFCCCNALNPPVNRWVSIEVLTKSSEWKKVELPDSVKAVVLLNLQSYAGGRNIWGRKRLTKKNVEQGFVEPSLNDGLFEVVGFRSGYHAGFVMASLTNCVRLAQGSAARIKAHKAVQDPAGEAEYMYMQIDGEPWKQRIPTTEGAFLSVDLVHNGCSSLVMNRRKMTQLDELPASSQPDVQPHAAK